MFLALTLLTSQASQVDCLAAAIYHESRGEPIVGQLAVGQVIINRTLHPKFPDTICEVVKQKGQFQFYKEGKWGYDSNSKLLATMLIKNNLKMFNALYFHSRSVNPRWKMRRIATIGNHVFY
jgi:N-acetylmuramoyl-L-alanine amidase